jgi:2-keto-4-pentenoate hydratase/2-oxohepta-3-ene-1,7-dioic acid hydratase in catechol pathway
MNENLSIVIPFIRPFYLFLHYMKIICIGRNYLEHAKELNNDVPTSPMLFMKPQTALLQDGKPFFHPDFSTNIHYELEIVLKICKNGKHISPEFAHKYYDQISVGLDFTARDLQDKLKTKGHPWEIAKAFDHSAVIGEWKSFEAFKNQNIHFQLKKNGELAQDGNTQQMIFNFDTIISYASQFFTLKQGDLIFTGTPAGVGAIKIGDTLEGILAGEKILHCEIK